MTAIRIAIARTRALFRRDVTMDDIREELKFHVEMRVDEYVRRGMDARTAQRAALRRFGNLAVIQDRGYDVRGGGVMETMLQDLKYGLRQLGQHPSFSIVAGLTLALGIAVSTALFSVIDAALLRPLPYPHPEELVTLVVEETPQKGKPSRYDPSIADIRIWRTLSTIVSHAGMGRVRGFLPLIVETATPQRLIVAEASEDFLETYGVTPILGRSIQLDDTRQGALPVALLGHAFWQREFGGDRNVLGRNIRIQTRPVTIIGVLPAGFYSETAVWQAKQFSGASLDKRGSGTPVIARLRPGVTLAQVGAALDAVTPASTMGPITLPAHVVIKSMYDDETSQFGTTIRTLSLAVGLILIIACVNVAGLTLARGASRDVELAIRASIGAGRGRLVRQLLTESVLLAAAGALIGVFLAYLSLDSLVALIPLSLPANSPTTINTTVLAFALALTFLTALLFGLVPALKLSRAPGMISTMLAVGGRSGAPLSKRAGQWLIAVEVALALVLMTGSGLILRSFARLVSVDLGFNTDNVLTLEVEPLDQTATTRREYYASLGRGLRLIPEVITVGAIDQLALTGGAVFRFAKADTGVAVGGPQRTVLPGYFEAMAVRPLAGRLFEDADRVTGEAAILNATASQTYFAGDAIGHTIRSAGKTPRQWRIVGVVPNMRHGGPQGRTEPELYVLPDPNQADGSFDAMAMVMRLREDASVSIDRLKQIAEAVGPRVLVGRVRPADAILSQQVTRQRHRMLLLTLLGVFGLLLTLVGIFSMTAYAVARRTREIGVRVAFGARPGQVVGVMIRDAAWPVAFGLVAGLAGTYYATRLLKSFLFQTTPHDPVTLGAVVAMLGAAACLAAWLPARRAVSVDAVTALRAE
ncbi:MAG: ABC transporter permease [Vicinamibacterales bacterium]